jgi:hypothetical protein
MLDLTQKTLLSALLVLGATAMAGCDDTLVLQDTPEGAMAYEELSRRWLEWALAQPYTQSAINDQTGERCAVNQGDEVWMLAGTHGGAVTRSCDIPANMPLFFPLLNRWIMPGLDPSYEPEDVPGFIAWVEEYFAWKRARVCSLTLTLDGEPLLADMEEIDQELYVAVTEPFDVYLDDDNWATAYGKQGGVYSYTFVDGHWALLAPLPPGDHVLELGGSTCQGQGDGIGSGSGDGSVKFTTLAVYELHVAEPDEGADDDE